MILDSLKKSQMSTKFKRGARGHREEIQSILGQQTHLDPSRDEYRPSGTILDSRSSYKRRQNEKQGSGGLRGTKKRVSRRRISQHRILSLFLETILDSRANVEILPKRGEVRCQWRGEGRGRLAVKLISSRDETVYGRRLS